MIEGLTNIFNIMAIALLLFNMVVSIYQVGFKNDYDYITKRELLLTILILFLSAEYLIRNEYRILITLVIFLFVIYTFLYIKENRARN